MVQETGGEGLESPSNRQPGKSALRGWHGVCLMEVMLLFCKPNRLVGALFALVYACGA
jgi:hypothetical protein